MASGTIPKNISLGGKPLAMTATWLSPPLPACHQESHLYSSPEAGVPHREGSRARTGPSYCMRHTGDMCSSRCLSYHHLSHTNGSPTFQPSTIELVHLPSHNREHCSQEKRDSEAWHKLWMCVTLMSKQKETVSVRHKPRKHLSS